MKILDFRPYAAAHDDDGGRDPWQDSVSWKYLMYDQGFEAGIFPDGKCWPLCKWGADRSKPEYIVGDQDTVRFYP